MVSSCVKGVRGLTHREYSVVLIAHHEHQPEDHYPQGGCACGRDLTGAADLGVARSYQQEEIPAAPAGRVQHDVHEVRCACGRPHVAARPPGVPDSALSIGPRLRALAGELVVFQYVPVERCQQLIADVTGAAVSAGFVHSCLRRRHPWPRRWCS